MLPHLAVQGRSQEHFGRRIRRQSNATQSIIRLPLRQFGKCVCGGRCHQNEISLISQTNVRWPPAFLLVVQAGHHRIARKRLERQGRDKLLRITCHNHVHLRAGFHQLTAHIHRLMRGDGAGDAEDDGFLFCH